MRGRGNPRLFARDLPLRRGPSAATPAHSPAAPVPLPCPLNAPKPPAAGAPGRPPDLRVNVAKCRRMSHLFIPPLGECRTLRVKNSRFWPKPGHFAPFPFISPSPAFSLLTRGGRIEEGGHVLSRRAFEANPGRPPSRVTPSGRDAMVRSMERQRQTIEVDGLRIRYFEEGAGPAVVLLHGTSLGSSADAFHGVITPLAESGYRVPRLRSAGLRRVRQPGGLHAHLSHGVRHETHGRLARGARIPRRPFAGRRHRVPSRGAAARAGRRGSSSYAPARCCLPPRQAAPPDRQRPPGRTRPLETLRPRPR